MKRFLGSFDDALGHATGLYDAGNAQFTILAAACEDSMAEATHLASALIIQDEVVSSDKARHVDATGRCSVEFHAFADPPTEQRTKATQT